MTGPGPGPDHGGQADRSAPGPDAGTRRVDPPRWAAALNRAAERATRPVANGRVPLHVAIDIHKALAGPFVLALMAMYDVFSLPAWIYLGLHGSYGAAWVIKDLASPDRRWRRRVSLLSATGALLFLSLYWVAPAILVLGMAGAVDLGDWTPAWSSQLAAAVFLYALGLVLMVGADVQKNVVLAERSRRQGRGPGRAAGGSEVGAGGASGPGLITDGFFRHVRHPNYLGEMLVYGSFALVVDHWLPWAILAAVWVLYFLPNMLAIEASLSRYPEYPAWRKRTGFLLPRVGRRQAG